MKFRLGFFLTLAALAWACQVTLDQVGDFACALDRTCPAGFACIGPDAGQCTPVALDGGCATDKDCASLGASVLCTNSRCMPPALGRRCVADSTCSSLGAKVLCLKGACGVPTLGGPCDSHSECARVDAGVFCLGGVCAVPQLGGPCGAKADCDLLDAGASCIQNTCQIPAYGGACDTSVQCAALDPALSCQYGTCLRGCTTTTECQAGDLCSISTDGIGVCTHPCTADTDCPNARLSCVNDPARARKLCVPPQFTFPSCRTVGSQQACALCGATGVYDVKCDAGTCAANSVCGPSNTCACSPGFTAVDCRGVACSGSNPCSAPNWWCKPNQAPPADTCATVPARNQETCTCYDGRSFAQPCGASESCNSLCASGCNTGSQNCVDSAQKCTVRVDAQGKPHTACLDVTGARAVGETCGRDGGWGFDDCLKGAFCSTVSAPPQTLLCRHLCRAGADCMGTEKCFAFSGLTPPDGLCLTSTCKLFDATCGAGRTCGVAVQTDGTWATECKYDGTQALGLACTSESDCAAGLTCSAGLCRALCDSTHTCISGGRCQALSGLSADGGVCSPN